MAFALHVAPAFAVEGGYPASGEPVGSGSHRASPGSGHGHGAGDHGAEPAAKHPAAKHPGEKHPPARKKTGKKAAGHGAGKGNASTHAGGHGAGDSAKSHGGGPSAHGQAGAGTASHGVAGHMPPATGPTPDEALKKLLEGNRRFVGSVFFHPGALPERRTELAKGQQPFAIVLGCADSRVPPELVFDQGLGDLFVIRVAGNVPSPHVLGSIEYAVEHLGSSVIVVLGHERCGAVSAAVDGGALPGSIGSLATAIKPAVDEIRIQRPTSADAMVDLCVRNNVLHVTRNILRQSPIVTQFVQAGRLRVQGARYDLDTGVVELIP